MLEIIKPIRYIQQQILPVRETIVTTVAREGGKKEYSSQSKESTEHSAEYLAGSTRNNYQAVEQKHETAAPIAPPPPPPTIVTSSVQHLVQAPEYQQPSSQVASIASNADDQISAMHNSYQPEMIAVSRRSSEVDEEEEQQRFVPTEAAATEPEPNDYQQYQQQLIDQIGQEYMTASSSALLSSVYGVSASTSPSSSGSGSASFRHQQQQQSNSAPGSIQLNEYTTIDADLVRQYMPLVYEVINSMESDRMREEAGDSGSGPVWPAPVRR